MPLASQRLDLNRVPSEGNGSASRAATVAAGRRARIDSELREMIEARCERHQPPVKLIL